MPNQLLAFWALKDFIEVPFSHWATRRSVASIVSDVVSKWTSRDFFDRIADAPSRQVTYFICNFIEPNVRASMPQKFRFVNLQ